MSELQQPIFQWPTVHILLFSVSRLGLGGRLRRPAGPSARAVHSTAGLRTHILVVPRRRVLRPRLGRGRADLGRRQPRHPGNRRGRRLSRSGNDSEGRRPAGGPRPDDRGEHLADGRHRHRRRPRARLAADRSGRDRLVRPRTDRASSRNGRLRREITQRIEKIADSGERCGAAAVTAVTARSSGSLTS